MLKSISSSAPVARDRRSFTVRGLLSAWHQRGRHPARCSKLAQFGNEVVQVSGTQPNQEFTGLGEFGRIGCLARNLQTERELSFGVNAIRCLEYFRSQSNPFDQARTIFGRSNRKGIHQERPPDRTRLRAWRKDSFGQRNAHCSRRRRFQANRHLTTPATVALAAEVWLLSRACSHHPHPNHIPTNRA